MEWVVVKTLCSLVAVLASMAGVVYLLKRFVYRGVTGPTSAVPVELLGQRSLQPKRSVVVLKVLHTVVVVGMSEQGMQTLATIDDDECIAELEDKLVEAETSAHRRAKRNPGVAGSFASSFSDQLETSMRRLLSRHGRQTSGMDDHRTSEAIGRNTRRSS